MLLDIHVKRFWSNPCIWRIIHAWNCICWSQVVQVLSKLIKFSPSYCILASFFVFLLLCLLFFAFFLELCIYCFVEVQLLPARVEVVHLFATLEASEPFLYCYCALREVCNILAIDLFLTSFFYLYHRKNFPYKLLYLYTYCALHQEPFAVLLHFIYWLYFKSGCVIAIPLFLSLAYVEVVFLDNIHLLFIDFKQ